MRYGIQSFIHSAQFDKAKRVIYSYFLCFSARMARASNALGLLVLGLALIEPTKAFTSSSILLDELINRELMDFPPPDESDAIPSAASVNVSSLLEEWSFGSITDSIPFNQEEEEERG